FKIDGQNLEYVVSHEQAHIRRRDHWWKPLGFLLLAIYWFNPLMWLSYVLLCRDIELACDEKVIKELGSRQRADYSQALLACSVSRRSIAACPVAFGEVGVKERVKSVLNYRKPAFWIIAAAIAACAVVAVCFLTDPSQRRNTLVWAQELSADDVSGASLTVSPDGSSWMNKNLSEDEIAAMVTLMQELSADDVSGTSLTASPDNSPWMNKNLSEDEIAAMVTLINQSKGKYVTDPEETAGRNILLYLTLQDGSTHEVRNIGNTYLVIDGDYYEAVYEWLSTWENYFAGDNALLPAGYSSEQPASGSELTFPSAETVPQETGPEVSIPEESASLDIIVWENVDLDQDGETETIHVREVSEGEVYELEVVKKDGTVLWSAEAGTPHVGWNTILLYQFAGVDYLIEYCPTVYQGIGNYTCRVLTLKGGVECEENYWETEFEQSSLQITSKMCVFAERVNDLLRHSTVLLSTIESELVIGPKTAEEMPLLYPIQFFPESEEPLSFIGEDALEDFLPLKFLFASGASSWGTSLTLYPDGHFEGLYEDGENIAAPEYPRGTSYYCKFSGRFSDITKVSEYAYTMRLEELTYETEVDKEWIEDQHRYIGSDALGIADGEEFMLYLPGTPLEELDEDFIYWWPDCNLWRDGSVNILSDYGIWNVNTGSGFFTTWLR
ncbi:MAG: M56 family metallopeptidase, partial [Acetatifactor sp.]|nr:M56 family metallopeptidase [Acetatifactor sp.]